MFVVESNMKITNSIRMKFCLAIGFQGYVYLTKLSIMRDIPGSKVILVFQVQRIYNIVAYVQI